MLTFTLQQDVIGAAETGSGKTLAFGLPILQRLLEEREKDSRLHQEDEKMEESSGGSPLRALILTPTRELAKQVKEWPKIVQSAYSVGTANSDALVIVELKI